MRMGWAPPGKRAGEGDRPAGQGAHDDDGAVRREHHRRDRRSRAGDVGVASELATPSWRGAIATKQSIFPARIGGLLPPSRLGASAGLAPCGACAPSGEGSLRHRNDVERHTFSFPRPYFARVLRSRCPSLTQRAQGKPGADRTRSLVCSLKKANEHSHHRFSRNDPTFPAQWCYGFLRALPGEVAFLATVAAWALPRSLTPGSRRQDHTTSPSAVNVSPGEPRPA